MAYDLFSNRTEHETSTTSCLTLNVETNLFDCSLTDEQKQWRRVDRSDFHLVQNVVLTMLHLISVVHV